MQPYFTDKKTGLERLGLLFVQSSTDYKCWRQNLNLLIHQSHIKVHAHNHLTLLSPIKLNYCMINGVYYGHKDAQII